MATAEATEAPTDFAHALRASGLRVTAPRLGVLLALQARPHADTETVIGSVREGLGSVSPQAQGIPGAAIWEPTDGEAESAFRARVLAEARAAECEFLILDGLPRPRGADDADPMVGGGRCSDTLRALGGGDAA